MDARKCQRCGFEKPRTDFYTHCSKKGGSAYSYCKACHSVKARKFYEKNKGAKSEEYHSAKRDVLAAYGEVCECCGEKNIGFLTIEHSLNDGKAHRDRVGGGRGTYLDLQKRGFPKDEGILVFCMNCNWASRGGRVCPHKAVL